MGHWQNCWKSEWKNQVTINSYDITLELQLCTYPTLTTVIGTPTFGCVQDIPIFAVLQNKWNSP